MPLSKSSCKCALLNKPKVVTKWSYNLAVHITKRLPIFFCHLYTKPFQLIKQYLENIIFWLSPPWMSSHKLKSFYALLFKQFIKNLAQSAQMLGTIYCDQVLLNKNNIRYQLSKLPNFLTLATFQKHGILMQEFTKEINQK